MRIQPVPRIYPIPPRKPQNPQPKTKEDIKNG